MALILASMLVAAAGWALIAWIGTGSFGFALLVFIILKVLGR